MRIELSQAERLVGLFEDEVAMALDPIVVPEQKRKDLLLKIENVNTILLKMADHVNGKMVACGLIASPHPAEVRAESAERAVEILNAPAERAAEILNANKMDMPLAEFGEKLKALSGALSRVAGILRGAQIYEQYSGAARSADETIKIAGRLVRRIASEFARFHFPLGENNIDRELIYFDVDENASGKIVA